MRSDDSDMTRGFTARHPRFRQALATALVVLAACLVAVWVAPRASGAAAAWMRTPSVRLQTLKMPGDSLPLVRPGARAGAPAVLDAGMRFSMAGVVCDVPGKGAVTVRVRTSLDGSAWGPWLEAPLEVADEAGGARAFTDPLWTGPARYVQVTAAGSPGGPSALSGVRLVAIDPDEDADPVARAVGAVRHVAATVAGIDLVPPAAAATAAPTIVTRAEWGADEGLRSGSPSYAPVKMAFVHHTAGGNDYTPADSPALMRGVYAYHTRSLGWSDIGYNFLIDRFGTIFEGRYGGMDRGVVGAQVFGFNTGSTGVSVMGTFTDEAPPTVVVTALERLLAWKLSVHGLDPAGTARLTCGVTQKFEQGASVAFPVVAGHRDANFTECPGAKLYALLPAIRSDVARRTQVSVRAGLSVSTPLISPNGDGVFDTTSLKVTLSTAADWRLTVRDARGDAVTSWSGQGTSRTVTWHGASGGTPVPDGVYTAKLTAAAAGVDAAPVTRTITVDTVGPRLVSAVAAPLTFSPNGDGRAETIAVTYRPAEACAVRVAIVGEDGAVVRWLHNWRARGTGSYSVTWDGRVPTGSRMVAARDGQYRFRIERRDAVDNRMRRGVRITLDRTLGFPTASPVTLSPNGDGRRDATTLGFKLARRAAVKIVLRLGPDVVRTLMLGTLEAGVHTTTWDGRAGSGEYLAGGRPVFTVTAVSTIGKSSVSKALIVDLYRPKLYAPTGKTARPATATRLGVKASDPFSAKVDLRFVITDSRGRRVASGHPGWVPTGQALSALWTPRSRGVFTVTWRATDVGGNREWAPATTRVVVR